MTSSPNQAGCYAVAVVLLVASTAAVGGRLNIRRTKKAALGFDDLFIILALVRPTRSPPWSTLFADAWLCSCWSGLSAFFSFVVGPPRAADPHACAR